MLLKYFKFIFLIVLLFITGCINNESGFSLDKLPEATVDQPYSVVIRIGGGAMPNKQNLNWEITPEGSGLAIRSVSERGWYDEIELYGTPKIQGNISVHLEGGGYGNPPYRFDRTFILKVNPPTKQDAKD